MEHHENCGGAIVASECTEGSQITDWDFRNNTSNVGGAIFINGDVPISGTIFKENHAYYFGGGIY